MLRKLEVVTNIALITVSVVISVVLVKNYLLRPAAPVAPKGVAPGMMLNLQGVDWQGHPQTLVLALREGCRYCSSSAPFYQRVRQAALHNDVRVIAIAPHSADIARVYLKELQVPIDEVRQVDFAKMGIRATPTILLVNHDGVVTKVWTGELPTEGEQEVLRSLLSFSPAGKPPPS